MFDYPPIVWHHDFSKSKLPENEFTSNVKFVTDYIRTSWGTFSLVEAKIRALTLLYAQNGPRYYVTLSGADYPIKSAEAILDELDSQGYDAYIRNTLITYHGRDKRWHYQYYDRYCSLKVLFKRKNKAGRKVISQITLLRNPLLTNVFTPFSANVSCWAGEFWYTGTKKTADLIIHHSKADPMKLISHYKNVKIPDESFFQTVLKNNEDIKCSGDNKRYIDWSEGLPHPKTLTIEDFDKIKNSGAHFARKFENGTSETVLNAIDKKVLKI